VWPADRRILYNRASADPEGRPWSERKAYVWWDAEKAAVRAAANVRACRRPSLSMFHQDPTECRAWIKVRVLYRRDRRSGVPPGADPPRTRSLAQRIMAPGLATTE
jgi:hypothetical protein